MINLEGENLDFMLGYQNLRVLYKGGSDSSDGSGEKCSVGWRVAAYLGMKSA